MKSPWRYGEKDKENSMDAMWVEARNESDRRHREELLLAMISFVDGERDIVHRMWEDDVAGGNADAWGGYPDGFLSEQWQERSKFRGDWRDRSRHGGSARRPDEAGNPDKVSSIFPCYWDFSPLYDPGDSMGDLGRVHVRYEICQEDMGTA